MTEYYEKKLKQGLYYQDIVVEELYKHGLPIISYSSKEFQNMVGENKAGIEIKNDQKFSTTGNFYIEIAEKSNPNNAEYVKSGIFRSDNTWLYIIGNSDEFYIFSKKQLQYLSTQEKFRHVEIPTSKGFLIPIEIAEKFYCIKKIKIGNKI